MLEADYQEKLRKLLDHVQCGVELPENWQDFHERKGAMPFAQDERRRFARMYFRHPVILETLPTLPAIPRRHEFFSALSKDISREGISLLHTQQLFPCEEITIWTPVGKLSGSVVRCTRHNDNCFEIAAFVEEQIQFGMTE